MDVHWVYGLNKSAPRFDRTVDKCAYPRTTLTSGIAAQEKAGVTAPPFR